jgi:DNA-binding NtrC family response regulator
MPLLALAHNLSNRETRFLLVRGLSLYYGHDGTIGREGAEEKWTMTRIAVVNDDTVFLDMMAAVLDERGWETEVYRETHNAFAALKANPPDLIILDIRMESPESGWTLLEVLTLDREMRQIPTIVCSGAIFDLRSHQDWLRGQGIQVLPKPFDIESLYRTVETALQAHRKDA